MSCNGCRVLRKGCTESCILRPCLLWIHTPQAQAHATLFLAKFFGRAGLISFLSAVPHPQRPSLFQSLLFEACGRTVNPVNGAVGLLWTGNWHICQAAVDTVLEGGTLLPINEFIPSDETDFTDNLNDLDLRLMPNILPTKSTWLAGTPSMNSDESETTTCLKSCLINHHQHRHCHSEEATMERKLLNLFV